jgi:hypothetical protein
MPRHFLRFICAFVLSAALNSCVQELTQEQYVACIRAVRGEIGRYYGTSYIAEYARGTNSYAVFSNRARKHVISAARRACDSLGVSYRVFNRSHEIYGGLKLPYSREVEEYVKALRQFLKRGTSMPMFEAGFDNLCYDLGLDNRVLLDVDKHGTILVDGIETPLDSILSAAGDYWGRVHIRLDSDAEERIFFDLVESLPEELFEPRFQEFDLSAVPTDQPKVRVVNISEYLSDRLYVRVRIGGLSSYEKENVGGDITVTLLITGEGQVFLNREPVDSSKLAPLIEALLLRSVSQAVILAADEDVKHGHVVEVARIAKSKAAASIHLMRRSDFEKLGLRINTEQILRKAPSEIRMK